MTISDAPLEEDQNHLLAHEFIRLFGRRPSPEELDRYREARVRVDHRMPGRTRRRLARLLTRI